MTALVERVPRAHVRVHVNHRHRDGEVVAWAFGFRVRLFAGHVVTVRPRKVHRWAIDDHAGLWIRLRGERCVGLQWRPYGKRRSGLVPSEFPRPSEPALGSEG